MNFRKKYGWDDNAVQQIKHIADSTRETQRRLVLRMAVRPSREDFFGNVSEEEYYIRVADMRDLTPYVRFTSIPYPDRDTLFDRYCALTKALDLPMCCLDHQHEYDPPMDNFLEDDNADFFGDIYIGFFKDDDDEDDADPLSSFLS